MLFSEIITVYSENHMKHISTLCDRNESVYIVKLMVHIVTTASWIISKRDEVQSLFDFKSDVFIPCKTKGCTKGSVQDKFWFVFKKVWNTGRF
jgi:hypothetical protein